MIAALAPGARLVRAFGSLAVSQYDTIRVEGQGKQVMFNSGDDPAANATVILAAAGAHGPACVSRRS